jgi:hypothetical protein
MLALYFFGNNSGRAKGSGFLRCWGCFATQIPQKPTSLRPLKKGRILVNKILGWASFEKELTPNAFLILEERWILLGTLRIKEL